MTGYIITGILMAAMYVLGYLKGNADGKKQKIEIVSNYVGDDK
ncbi:hypothetical protein [Aeromonas salmonicida]